MILFVSFIAFLLLPSMVYGAVVINEVYPKADPKEHQFIELYNNGTDTVSLDRWRLNSFILNASSIIQPNNFLVFSNSQTGIDLSAEGDTVKLFDEKGTLVDSQSYPGVLGYNTSMGRTTDGAGVWAVCSMATYQKPNTCPMPTSTPTPVSGSATTPTATHVPVHSNSPTSTIVQAAGADTLGFLRGPDVLGDIATPTPTPPAQDVVVLPRVFVMQLVIVLVGWGIIALVTAWRNKRKKRNMNERA